MHYILYIEKGEKGFIGISERFMNKADAVDFAAKNFPEKNFKLMPVELKKRADGSIWEAPVVSIQ